MSSPPQPPPQQSTAEMAGRMKDMGRETRLSFRNFAEHQLRREFKDEAMEKCDLQIRTFAECGQQEGIMVVFRCREFQKDITECMTVYNSPEAFEAYKTLHAADLDNRVIKTKTKS
jgi:COX assembly protein 1